MQSYGLTELRINGRSRKVKKGNGFEGSEEMLKSRKTPSR